MDFGLNLILTFTDNATSQLKGVISSIENVGTVTKSMDSSLKNIEGMASLSSLAVSAQQTGQMFLEMGSNISGVITGLVQRVINVGSEFEGFKITLEQLYGSAKKADTQLGKLLQFSATTPFEVDDVKDLVVVLKSQGLEAFKNIKGEVTATKQQTLAWLGDLMAFKPDIPASRWRLAFTNYLGSGAPKVLQNLLDMGSIEKAVGHAIGDTAEERLNTLVEFIEKKNVGGLMSKMFGTWQQTISNLDDTFTMLYKDIGDTGAFDNFKLALNNVAGALIELDKTGRLQSLAEVIGDALDPLANFAIFVTGIIKNLIIGLVDFADTHPVIVKTLVLLTSLFSVVAIGAGVALVALSKFAFMINTLREFASVGGILANVGSSFLSLATTIGLTWALWNSNLFGIQTLVFDFVSGCIDAWNAASEVANMSAEDMMSVYNKLDRNTFFDNLTAGLIKAIVFIRALSDAWSDGEMDAELYQKAVDIGVIDLVSRILDLKYRVEEFVKGFKKGWNEASESIRIFIEDVAKNLKGTIFESVFNGAEKFFTLITEANLKDWRNFGKDVGELAPKVIALGLAFKVLSKAASGLSTIGTILGGLGKIKLPKLNIASMISQNSIVDGISTAISNAFAAGGAGANTAGAFTNLLSVMFEGVNIAAVGVVAAGVLASIFAFAFDKPEEFKGMLTDFITGITERFEEFKENVKTFFDPIIDSFNNIKEAASNLWDALQQGWNDLLQNPTVQAIIGVLSAIGETIMGTVLPVLESAIDFIISLVEGAVNIISETIGGVIDIVSGVFNLIAGLITGDGTLIQTGIYQILQGVINIITSVIGTIVNLIRTVLEAIGGFIVGAVQGVASFVGSGVNLILTIINNFITGALDNISGFVTSVLRFFGFAGLADTVERVFNTIKSKISGIIDNIKGIVTRGVEAFKKAFNFTWKLPDIKLPHFKVTGGEAPFGIMGKGSLPKLDVSWYQKGGVFNKPDVIGVGEAGTEAVMPLEKNLEWIDVLAQKLTGSMSNVSIQTAQSIPTNTGVVAPISYGNTTNNTNNSNMSTDARNVDNSVVFNSGAIQINMMGGSDVDVKDLAKKIMSEIARQHQIQNSMNYGINFAAGGI